MCVREARSEVCTGVVGGGPHQSVRRGVHGLELDALADGVVGADFEHLLASHQQAVALLSGWKRILRSPPPRSFHWLSSRSQR